MTIKYVVRLISGINTSEDDRLRGVFVNRGFENLTEAFKYSTKIVEYCEENYGIRNIHMQEDDEYPSGIALGLGSGLYDSATIEIEQCNFEVGES